MSPAPPGDPARPGSPSPLAGHAWDGGARGWDVYYGLVLVGVLALVIAVQAQQDRPAADLAVSCGALAAMAPWYALNRRTLHYGEGSLARGLIYLAGLWVLFIIASSQGYIETWVLLALGPQCFLAVPFRWAVGAIVVFNVTPVVVALITGPGPGELASLIASGVLTVAFSVMFGLWVFRIIAQSYERASLISELGQTRAELAQANRTAGVLAERQRLSGEIHDTVAQGFTSIIMLLQAADADVGRSRPRPASISHWPCRPPGRTWPKPAAWWPRWPRPGWSRVRSTARCAG